MWGVARRRPLWNFVFESRRYAHRIGGNVQKNKRWCASVSQVTWLGFSCVKYPLKSGTLIKYTFFCVWFVRDTSWYNRLRYIEGVDQRRTTIIEWQCTVKWPPGKSLIFGACRVIGLEISSWGEWKPSGGGSSVTLRGWGLWLKYDVNH